MIIDNVEALKSWLAILLEPICDADPSALANYVVALVKKDKPEDDLRALCADQLDVFLQQETVGFVDKLFECLTTKKYLGNPTVKEEVVPKEEAKHSGDKTETAEVGIAEEDKGNRRRRSPLRNHPDFNETSRGRGDRRRDERKRREVEHHGKTSDESHRGRRDRRRDSPRGRSYSRSRSRSGSRGKSRDDEHSRGRDYRSKFEVERKDPETYTSSGSTPLQKPFHQHPSPLLPLPTPQHAFPSSVSGGLHPPSLPSIATAAKPAHLPGGTTVIWSSYYGNHREAKPFKSISMKQRCRDYDEKGFCVRGDLCPFDHGNDPLIVDDVSLPAAMIPFPPPSGMTPARLPIPHMIKRDTRLRMPIFSHSQPAPPGIFPTGQDIGSNSPSTFGHKEHIPVQLKVPTDNYELEGYNPESPGISAEPGQPQYRQFIPRIQTKRSNLIGLTSGEGQGHRANIVIQTEPPVAIVPSNVTRYASDQDNRKRPMNNPEGPPSKMPWLDKPNFNNQHKHIFPKKNHYINTKLEVRKIPRDLNTITKLNEHFSKFGTIVNIQVAFGGDPEAALIQYTANEEARRAISSTEAVLNNRFIRVYWHREPNAQQDQNQGQGTSMVPQHTAHHTHNPGAYVLNKNVAKHPLAGPGVGGGKLDLLLPSTDLAAAVSACRAPQKGPFLASMLKASGSKTLGKTAKALEAQEALKKKQEAMKLQQNMRKKKQEMLEKQIECQKALINRLERNRGMKPEERTNIMKTLKDLTDKITQLQNEMSPAVQSFSSTRVAAVNPGQPKTKTDAQKDLLDAEMDFHQKLSLGEDTGDLKRRLRQLEAEATWLGLIVPAGRGKAAVPRGRGRGRGRGVANHMVVDHRPRALAILGLTQEEKGVIMPHFLKFGEIEDLRDHDATSVVMTFKTRNEAENAANLGAKFNGRMLQISWYKPQTPSVSAEPKEEDSKEEVNTEEQSPYLLPTEEEEEDDDEDDEYESRSWRR